ARLPRAGVGGGQPLLRAGLAGAGVRAQGDPVLAAAHPHRGAGGRGGGRVRAGLPRRPPVSDDLRRRHDARVFYTWSAQRSAVPLEIGGGEGARFTTADGARWWDLGSMTWNATLGHGHPRLRAALGAAAADGLLAYPTSVFPAKVRAAELLAEVT